MSAYGPFQQLIGTLDRLTASIEVIEVIAGEPPNSLGKSFNFCAEHFGQLSRRLPSASLRGIRELWRASTKAELPRKSHPSAVAKRAAADIEGHSEAAKYGQPGRLNASVDARFAPVSSTGRRNTTRRSSPAWG
jgi:hypothetical protein